MELPAWIEGESDRRTGVVRKSAGPARTPGPAAAIAFPSRSDPLWKHAGFLPPPPVKIYPFLFHPDLPAETGQQASGKDHAGPWHQSWVFSPTPQIGQAWCFQPRGCRPLLERIEEALQSNQDALLLEYSGELLTLPLETGPLDIGKVEAEPVRHKQVDPSEIYRPFLKSTIIHPDWSELELALYSQLDNWFEDRTRELWERIALGNVDRMIEENQELAIDLQFPFKGLTSIHDRIIVGKGTILMP